MSLLYFHRSLFSAHCHYFESSVILRLCSGSRNYSKMFETMPDSKRGGGQASTSSADSKPRAPSTKATQALQQQVTVFNVKSSCKFTDMSFRKSFLG